MTATMEPLVETLIEDGRWDGLGLADRAETVACAVVTALGMAQVGYAISLLGCDDRRIAELNADFRGKPQPTNVLSWPSEERGAARDGAPPLRVRPGPEGMPAELGDVAVAWETCAREAADQDKTVEDHVTHLLVHGFLHLLGFDHVRDGDAALMEATETRILSAMGIANPYR